MILVSINLAILASYAPVVTGMLPPVRDAWLSTFIAAVPAALISFVTYTLVRKFAGETVFSITHTVLGRFFGTAANVVITIYALFWTAVLVREFALIMDSVIYLRTPDVVFVTIFIILAIVGAGRGIEFIGRIAEFSGPLVMTGIFFLIVANIPQIDLGMLRPVLAEGWPRIFQQSLTPMGIFVEAVWVVLIVGPHLNNLGDAPKAIGTGLGINVFFSVISAAVLVAMFGPELIPIISFVPLTAARLIQIGQIVERLEWVLLLLWFGSMGVKVSLLLFAARKGLSSLLPRSSRGVALLVVSAIVFGLSLVLFPTLPDILDYFAPDKFLVAIAPLQLLPLLLLAVAFLRRLQPQKGGGNEG